MTRTPALIATPGDPPAPHAWPEVRAAASQTSALPEDLSPDLRLVIEEDSAANTYVYKTVNRVTGEVVQQYPREEVLKLRAASDYQPGHIIRTGA